MTSVNFAEYCTTLDGKFVSLTVSTGDGKIEGTILAVGQDYLVLRPLIGAEMKIIPLAHIVIMCVSHKKEPAA